MLAIKVLQALREALPLLPAVTTFRRVPLLPRQRERRRCTVSNPVHERNRAQTSTTVIEAAVPSQRSMPHSETCLPTELR